MKKFILKLLFVCLSIFIIPNITKGDLTLHVPNVGGQEDYNIIGPTSVSTNETEIIDVINIVNKYLWFILGGLALAVFIYSGIILITGGKKENMGKANKMMLYSVVALVIAMLSYTIVNILIKLF